jgi:1-acyl-sn-glycerol-3-phosphate acyltransferase
MSTALRRAGTIPLFLLLTALMTVTLPLWLPVAWLVSGVFPAARTAPRVLAFLTAYLWCETIGIVVSGWLWLRHGLGRSPEARKRFEEGNFALQFWWANALKRAAERLFRLRFVVEGDEVLGGDGVLLLPRHCSIGDTILPVVFYCVPHGRRLRYVLKRELLLDPCLDIVGNRLPNYFADRSSTDTAREVAGVQGLLEELPADHSVLIYPEGTRFSAAKRAHVLQRIEARGDAAATARARARSHVLPPRPAGTLGLLEANPGRDVVFMAHTGFEQSSNFAQLFNGSWLDTEVRMRFWRVPFEALPTTPDGRRAFLDEQWDRMEREVAQLVGDRADVTIDSP